MGTCFTRSWIRMRWTTTRNRVQNWFSWWLIIPVCRHQRVQTRRARRGSPELLPHLSPWRQLHQHQGLVLLHVPHGLLWRRSHVCRWGSNQLLAVGLTARLQNCPRWRNSSFTYLVVDWNLVTSGLQGFNTLIRGEHYPLILHTKSSVTPHCICLPGGPASHGGWVKLAAWATPEMTKFLSDLWLRGPCVDC